MSGARFRPCFLVPIYDHGATIRRVVESIAPYGLPIYVIDDGSHAPTQAALAALARDFPTLRLRRLEPNAGKGAAVVLGMRLALAEGMTHALQMDADGQHDALDVPRFLERGAARPEALIVGRPLFDAAAPRARRYGHSFTNFWVRIETLSLEVADALCGYRLYPLAASCALADAVALPRRMAFDIAIMVRLAWRGVPVESLATRVVYPPGGVSHFDVLRDNARISAAHTALVFGMVLRLPLLLARKLGSAPR